MMSLGDLRKYIETTADTERAKHLMAYFQTGKGGYGADDVFVGLMVPQSRKIAMQFKDLPLSDVLKLLTSKVHEERLIALFILVNKFEKGDRDIKKEIYDAYLAHTQYVNNWDLVDSSADKIVGGYLWYQSQEKGFSKNICHTSGVQPLNTRSREGLNPFIEDVRPHYILERLARSPSLWERRIAIIATFYFIKKGESELTLKIAEMLLSDTHDLIHKAVGWMLREVGEKVSREQEEEFLKKHYHTMPRTMLRYAIEKFENDKRKKYLVGEIV